MTGNAEMKHFLTYGVTCGLIGFLIGAFLLPVIIAKRAEAVYTMRCDFNGDGVNDALYWYSNDVPIRTQWDRNFDGRMDYLELYTNGAPHLAISDDRFDDKPSAKLDFVFGQISVFSQDADSNGIPDIVHVYSNGIIARSIYQPNGTGAIMKSLYFTNGILREESGIWIAKSNSVMRILYDPYGRPVEP